MNLNKDAEDGDLAKATPQRRKKGGPRRAPRRLQHFEEMLHGWKYRPAEGGQFQPATEASEGFEDELDFRNAMEDLDSERADDPPGTHSDNGDPTLSHAPNLRSPSPRWKPLDNSSRIPSHELLLDFSVPNVPVQQPSIMLGQTTSPPSEINPINISHVARGNRLEVPSSTHGRRALPRTSSVPQSRYRGNFPRSTSLPAFTIGDSQGQYDMRSMNSHSRFWIPDHSTSDRFSTLSRSDEYAPPMQHSWDSAGASYLTVPPSSPFSRFGEYAGSPSFSSPSSVFTALSDPGISVANKSPLQGNTTHPVVNDLSRMGEGSVQRSPCITLSAPSENNSDRLSPLHSVTYLPQFEPAPPSHNNNFPSSSSAVHQYQGIEFPSGNSLAPISEIAAYAPTSSPATHGPTSSPSNDVVQWANAVAVQHPRQNSSAIYPFDCCYPTNSFPERSGGGSVGEFTFASSAPASADFALSYDDTSPMPVNDLLLDSQSDSLGNEFTTLDTGKADNEMFSLEDLTVRWDINGTNEFQSPYQDQDYVHFPYPQARYS